ncbi:hypothetical protein Ciccas_011566 [Cichlidogyrus casuarinus]|uniref:Uncharacterized protein n=1 Tax=Cichlidogyrus casuarinus TaxID=1844966 RepID=A0ABD2PQV6_9PLAT
MLWGLEPELLFRSLMWGDLAESKLAIPIEELEAHCPCEDSAVLNGQGDGHNLHFYKSRILSYAASSLVSPVRVASSLLPVQNWNELKQEAKRWGLLTAIMQKDTPVLLITKQVPLPRLKSTLLQKKESGVFVLHRQGSLPEEMVQNLSLYESLSERPILHSMDGLFEPMPKPVHGHMNIFSDCPPTSREPTPSMIDCSFNGTDDAFSGSEQVEIIDDLPKQLIPGIDF